MPRFSESPVVDPAIIPNPIREAGASTTSLPPAPDVRGVGEVGKSDQGKESAGDSPKRTAAARLIESIGTEFSRLRKSGRSGAWADLEDKVAKSGHLLTDSGMMSVKDWVGMMIDIEQFRKAEGGSSESPGDALAKWLSEGVDHIEEVASQPKKKRKEKVQ